MNFRRTSSSSLSLSLSFFQVDRQYQNFLVRHPDGKISKKEFSDMLRQCYPDADTAKMEKHIFRMYDANRDGDIDFRWVGSSTNFYLLATQSSTV